MKLTAEIGTTTKIATVELTSWVLSGWTLIKMDGYQAVIKKIR